MRASIERLPRQDAETQAAIEAAVASATPDQVGKDGLFRIIIGALIFVGRLFFLPRYKRFVWERTERVSDAKARAEGKKSASSEAKRPSEAKRSKAKTRPKK
ncbi:MAG TPA: hypothetical protein PKG57_05595 [Flavobacteriales bacterium]|nr:hypothetical protein [Flavobacteriales bacterium]HNM69113.1 hypothetical protein [Flavobacteriales bacterium]